MTGLELNGDAGRRKWAMLALTMGAGLASLGTSLANIALPAVATAFGAPFHEVQGVVVAYLGALTLCVLLAGRLGDRFGMKRMLLTGLALFALASLACGLAPTLPLLIMARAVQGAGAACMMTLSMSLVRQMAGLDRLGRAMGLLGTVSAIGTALGPSLGGLLLAGPGWRATFALLLLPAVVALILGLVFLPDSRRAVSTGRPGRVLGWRLLATLFCNGLVAAVMMTTLVVGPFYLGSGLGLAPMAVGLVMAIGPVLSILSGIPSGRLVDAVGAQVAVEIGAVLLAAGAFMLVLLPNMAAGINYVAAIGVLTPGYQLFQAANNTAAMRDVQAENRGTVSGLVNLSRNIGLIFGAVAMGAVFAHGVGTQALQQAEPAAVGAGMRLVFALAGVMMVMALGISLGMRRLPPSSR